MTAGKRTSRGAFSAQVSIYVCEISMKKGKKRCWEKNEFMPSPLPNASTVHMLSEAMLHRMKAIIDAKAGVTKY